ncbi:pyrimidine-nucleoside phosphorylase [Paenibacillus pini]|uniref:Pyrimidine-nucleoside phosphorylase n=1 Tax=Paenibacillus pini JCM 16418 TaxID=1236976 RepID=W7Y9D4_9BACL|nr:pyrimidine-nucleoside phosphorylase [Paenibacillus pini]GAF07590.1 pyrimidine-nucleoside phosphorylase [Paenibacillus pini JCM 16418]
MRMSDLILKKKHGEILTKEEITFMISKYSSDEIPDYQMAAFAMAVCFQGMDDAEVSYLTHEMAFSGDTIDLSGIDGIKVDKHSSGGVGDKTSLIVLPLVASLGIKVAKMSGRGLGHTGGTLDKLEAIEGFRIELSDDEFIQTVNEVGISLIGQTLNLVPADKKLYGLRDATGTVDSIPLIASSIMSKKIASGADAIVLDVKVGSGAFMKTVDDAKELAKLMVSIGSKLNRKTVAILSNMEEPLGHEVGNANEIKEVVEVLKGHGETKLTELCLELAAQMMVLGEKQSNKEEAIVELREAISSGKALEKFKEFIEAQGGNSGFIDDYSLLPQAKETIEVLSETSGYITAIDAEEVGISAMLLGAGRKTKADKIDYAVGITVLKKTGSKVEKGDVIAHIHSNGNHEDSVAKLKKAFTIENTAPVVDPIIYEVIQ